MSLMDFGGLFVRETRAFHGHYSDLLVYSAHVTSPVNEQSQYCQTGKQKAVFMAAKNRLQITKGRWAYCPQYCSKGKQPTAQAQNLLVKG